MRMRRRCRLNELRAAYIPSPRAGVNLIGQLTANGKQCTAMQGCAEYNFAGPEPLQRRGRTPWMEVTRFCREQNRTAEGRPRSGVSRGGVRRRDASKHKSAGSGFGRRARRGGPEARSVEGSPPGTEVTKKTPETRGERPGPNMSRLVPGLPAQGGGAGIDKIQPSASSIDPSDRCKFQITDL